jgi:serine/threonine-protein kinase
MGVVLLAEDVTLGREVAIKFIHAHLLDDGFRERFTMEARAMARVNHPNTLQIHSFGDHEGAPYFVMEYIAGITLDAWMSQHTLPDVDLSLRILEQVCAGVAAIHAAETVHRDIKPSNILIDSKESPHVADLGLAVLLRRGGTRPREIVGTPAYMAPEVAFPSTDGAEPGERADVYSLACVAYELLTGRSPFIAESAASMMFQHAAVAAARPSSLRACLPRSLDEAVLRALAKNPAERTSTVAEFGAALQAARAESPEPARILIADDNDDFREVLAGGLELAFPSAVIECVRNGRAALAAYDRSRPSLTIVDLSMPEVDGMALIRLLRTRDPSAVMPIVVMTGSGGPREWALLAAIGVDRLLVKPVALDDVVSLVQRLTVERSKTTRPPPPALPT